MEILNRNCLQNVVCTVTCNFGINLKKFNDIYGGQYTDKLPAVRKHCYIFNKHSKRKDLRYGYIVYSTGMIVITNILGEHHEVVFKYFSTLIISMVRNGVTDVRDKTKLRPIKFLMENFSFAFCMSEAKFAEKYLCVSDTACLHPENLRIVLERVGVRCYECARHRFFDYLLKTLKEELGADRVDGSHKSLMMDGERSVSFPADHLEILFLRSPQEDLTLIENKSHAARKRKISHNENNPTQKALGDLIFGQQRVSLHIFSSGKFIITGAQTNKDLDRIVLSVMSKIFYYFFNE